jgi:predicted nucleic acid-binding protein
MHVEPHNPCFVDTIVWLYAFIDGSQPEKSAAARELIAASQPVVSVQVVNEVCVNLLKNADFTEHQIMELVRAFNDKYRVVELDMDILTTASRLREQYPFSYWESMMVSSALHAGAGVLYSDDLQPELVIDRRLRIVNPFTIY